MENEYIITYVENGEEKTITRIETEEELRERIATYIMKDIIIKRILKKVVIIRYVEYLDY